MDRPLIQLSTIRRPYWILSAADRNLPLVRIQVREGARKGNPERKMFDEIMGDQGSTFFAWKTKRPTPRYGAGLSCKSAAEAKYRPKHAGKGKGEMREQAGRQSGHGRNI